MRRLWLSLLALLALSSVAQAVVRPPEEWFAEDRSAREALWQQMWPQLNNLEFEPQPPLLDPPQTTLTGIEQQLGQTRATSGSGTTRETEVAELKLDLNLDGVIDQFDVLELGYTVQAATRQTSIAPPVGTNQLIVFRSDFSDVNANYGTYTTTYLDDRLFKDGATPYQSMRDYYEDVSYNQLVVDGDVDNHGPNGDGWWKGDNTKQWYADNGGQWLVREAVLDADPFVDFSDYDVDGDGYVDTCCIYYPGPVVWNSGLHPHRSSGLNISVDGVIVDSYFLSVLEAGAPSWLMEITCHEYGHILGLPDLYDVNGGSNGLGRWSLMAYNYDGQHKVPSVDPWCKIQLGWLQPKLITENQIGYNLPCFQDSPEVLKVWTNGKEEDQYFLLANYRLKKTDTNRPGEGLMIQHIDDSIGGGNSDNANHFRKHVDLESARGWQSGGGTASAQDHLDVTNNGASTDLWRADNKPSFSDASDCDAKRYNGSNPPLNTGVSVTSISAPGDTMTMDITVRTATAPTCTIDAPLDTSTQTGNATVDVTASATTGRTIARVDFWCNGAYLGQDTSDPYSLTFDSRAIYNGATRVVRAVCTDSASEIGIDTVSVEIDNAAEGVPYLENFAANIGAWAAYNNGGDQRWRHFNTAVGGVTNVAGLGQTSGNPGGYDYNEHDLLVSRRFDLGSSVGTLLRWKQRVRVVAGENTCRVFLTADEGQTFTELATYTGTNSAWVPKAILLEDYLGQSVRLVFQLDSSSLAKRGGDGGWWIDDVELKLLSDPPQVLSITPGTDSTVSGTTTITVSASDDESVAAVDFVINETDVLFTDSVSPFTYDWTSSWVFNGSHEFTAIALDGDGQSAELSVDWTTDNTGLTLPFADSFASAPGGAWRILDQNGSGNWKRLATGGYSSGPGMYCGITNTYDDMENDWLITPTLSFSGVTRPGLSFYRRYDLENTYDYGRVYITTDLNTWSQLFSYTGLNAGWALNSVLLNSYSGQQVKLAFVETSDVGVVEEGLFIDEVLVASTPIVTGTNPTTAVNGQPLIISGTNFGSGAALDNPQLSISGQVMSGVTWSDTQLTVTIPAALVSGDIVVTRRGLAGSPYALRIKLPPPTAGGLGQID